MQDLVKCVEAFVPEPVIKAQPGIGARQWFGLQSAHALSTGHRPGYQAGSF
jgi:hypothetical protein